MEVSDRVHSPTFTLMNVYGDGRLRLFHLDLYRLESREQIQAAGLEEYLYRPDGVAVVEWAERWFAPVPNSEFRVPGRAGRFRRARIEMLSESERRITYEDFGP